MEQAELGPFEWLAESGGKGRHRGEHGRFVSVTGLQLPIGRPSQGGSDGAGQRRAKKGRSEPRTDPLGSHGHNIYTLSPGVQSKSLTSSHHLVGINLSEPLSSFQRTLHVGVLTCPEKKKGSPAPIFPKFVRDAAILARKRGRGGASALQVDENPVAVLLTPPDQSHARLEVNEPRTSISRS